MGIQLPTRNKEILSGGFTEPTLPVEGTYGWRITFHCALSKSEIIEAVVSTEDGEEKLREKLKELVNLHDASCSLQTPHDTGYDLEVIRLETPTVISTP